MVGVHKDTISERMKECRNLDKCPKSDKLSALFEDGSTQQEIADAVGADKATISRRLEDCCNIDKCPKSNKLSAMFEDELLLLCDRLQEQHPDTLPLPCLWDKHPPTVATIGNDLLDRFICLNIYSEWFFHVVILWQQSIYSSRA